jgi:hypothetical protein
MHFTSLVAVLAASSVASAALTYNVTKAMTRENFKKYKCLYAPILTTLTEKI